MTTNASDSALLGVAPWAGGNARAPANVSVACAWRAVLLTLNDVQLHGRDEPLESVRAWDALHKHYGEPSFEWDVWLAPAVTLYSKRITPFYEKRACRISR